MGKKASATSAKKSTSTATASTSTSSHKSSILRSAFAPSKFQLRLFASVIQSFESQQLRVHDTTTSRLRSQHPTEPGATIHCLAWGRYTRLDAGQSSQASQKKKRKRGADSEDVIVAYGTNQSKICMFSPTEGKLVGKLGGVHERGVEACTFSRDEQSIWSIGGDSKLVQWDLKTDNAVRSIMLSDSSIKTICPPSTSDEHILCASSTPYSISLADEDDFRIQSFDSMKNTIQSLQRSGTNPGSDTQYFLAADTDRYINIYDIPTRKLVHTLIAGSGVDALDLLEPEDKDGEVWGKQVLAVLTEDGSVDMFPHPFVRPLSMNGDLKASRKSMTEKSTARIRLVNNDVKKTQVSVLSVLLQGPELLVASVDSGVDVSFQKIRWQDEGTGELLFEGTKDVMRIKSLSTFSAASTNGVKDYSKSQFDDSKAVVSNGVVVLDSSSDEEKAENGPLEGQESVDSDSASEGAPDREKDEVEDSDEEMEDLQATHAANADEAEPEEPEDAAEPSFGEMLATRQANEITIADAFEPESAGFSINSGGALSIPTGMSLGTVLTQALRTNDRSLLEACLHTTDTNVVRNTIQRLDSSLAGILFSKLAERMATRHGRYGHLQDWVQQLCVAHGAAFTAQPNARKQLKVLFNVLDQRAKSLSHLLLLKGKLDMLDAQLQFRKQLAAQRAQNAVTSKGEPGMIYIEGEADNWDSEDDLDEVAGVIPIKRVKSSKANRRDLDDLIESEGSDDESMPLANGVSASDSEDDEEDSDVEQKPGGLVDGEAEEERGSSEGEDSEGDDVDTSSEEEDDEDEDSDSEIDDFINDASSAGEEIEAVNGQAASEAEDDTPQKPPTKKLKQKHR